jgi:DNA-binding response OmpR family regulator/DNA invertase Pin-like site-specific DNA recombinase
MCESFPTGDLNVMLQGVISGTPAARSSVESKQPTILIVEDHRPTRTFLADNLLADGYEPLIAATAGDGLRLMAVREPDLAVIDLGLPDRDGLDLLRELRASAGTGRAGAQLRQVTAGRLDPNLPVILLTARAGELDRVRGFERGCDDYLVKPFSYPELRGRIAAILRRARRRPLSGRLRIGALEIDPLGRNVELGGEPVHLSNKEFALLRALAEDPTRVFTRIYYGPMSKHAAIAYIRVSVVGDREAQGTLETDKLQRNAIASWAERNGVEIVGEVEDKNASGLRFTRPGLERALEQAIAADAGVVVAYGDRYARNTELGLRLLREAEERGSWIKSADGTLDISTPNGTMMTTQFLASWQNYAETRRAISEVVHERAILEKGRQMGETPFGYRRDADKRLVVNEREAETVRFVFKARADGRGWSDIGRDLAAKGVKQANGNALSTHTLRRMVTHRVYLGEAKHGKHVKPDAHAAIIDEVLFAAAKRIAPAVASDAPNGREHPDSLLRGLMRCAGCRYVLKRMVTRTGAPRWRCRTALAEKSCTHECCAPTMLTVRQGADVEERVVEEFMRLASHVSVEPATTATKIAELERNVHDAEALLDEISTLEMRRDLGSVRWSRMVAEAREAVDAAEQALAQERTRARIAPGADRVTLEAAWAGMTLSERQESLRSIVQAVMVDADGSIDVIPVWEQADVPRKGARGFVARPWGR